MSDEIDVARRRSSRRSELLVEEGEHVNDGEIRYIAVEVSESVGIELKSLGKSGG